MRFSEGILCIARGWRPAGDESRAIAVIGEPVEIAIVYSVGRAIVCYGVSISLWWVCIQQQECGRDQLWNFLQVSA